MTVPLDRSGSVPGTVHLFVERVAGTPPVHGAIIALQGGPGAAATPLTADFASVLSPALAGRDLIVFDQRGSGRSDPIACPSLNGPQIARGSVTRCAARLGARRGFYTTRDSADDIDAIRQSLGLDKISLYGASYGTYTALTYARRYPSHVETLVLDSTIAPNGRDPFERSTFAAVRRVVRSLCADDCRRITHSPGGDLARLVARLRRHPLRAHAFGARGRPVKVAIGADDLFGSVLSTDQDPTARADLPGAIVAALRGDSAPLARLMLRQQATLGGSGNSPSAALFFATSCEEIGLPWSRTARLSTRERAAQRAIARVGRAKFAPWTPGTELRTGIVGSCLGWPDAQAQSPAVTGPVPDVPLLALEGTDDMRTPVADAQAVAGLFPHSTLVVVPHTGHGVLFNDLSSCSHDALVHFFSGQPVASCGSVPNLFPPTSLPPTSLRHVPATFLHGVTGRTLTAVAETLDDATIQALDYSLFLPSAAAGGLRGGLFRAVLTQTQLVIRLRHYAYVPGVFLDGTARLGLGPGTPRFAHVRVGGSGAHGTLTFTNTTLVGRLGGHPIRLVAAAGLQGSGAFYDAARRLLARGGIH